jgi:YidC/Oxa1 family membrane protein insertase
MTQFFYNFLVFFSYLIPGRYVWIAIALITVLLRFIFVPSSFTMARMQKKQKSMQGRMNEIKEKHKDDKTAQQQALMDLYKQEKFNPLSGCLPSIVQIVVLIGFYGVFTRIGLGGGIHSDLLYSFTPRPDSLNTAFFGLDLTRSVADLVRGGGAGVWALAFPIVAGGLQLVLSLQMKAVQAKPKPGEENAMTNLMAGQFTYIFPLMTAYISYTLVAALSVYWVVQTAFMVIQQKVINNRVHLAEEVAEIESKELAAGASLPIPKSKTIRKKGVEVTVREKS